MIRWIPVQIVTICEEKVIVLICPKPWWIELPDTYCWWEVGGGRYPVELVEIRESWPDTMVMQTKKIITDRLKKEKGLLFLFSISVLYITGYTNNLKTSTVFDISLMSS